MDSEEEFVDVILSDLESGKLQLPTLPEVALKVRDAVEDPDASANQVADVIAQDAAVTARLIQVVNSPLYRARQELDQLPMIVTRLGSQLVRNLVTAQVMKQMFQATNAQIDERMRAMWSHSIDVAGIARAFSSRCPGVTPDQAMLAGLLHDIGALPILYYFEQHEELMQSAALLDYLIEALHARIGQAILTHWKFPQHLIDVAGEHENLARTHDGDADLVDLVQVANLQALAGSEHRHGDVDWTQVPAFAKLGFTDDAEEIELTDIAEEVGEVRNLFA